MARENCWDEIDAMKKSGDRLLERLRNRRNGWKMKDPKPDGTMVAERSSLERFDVETQGFVVVRTRAVVTGKTHAEVWEKVVRVDGLCPKCFHKLTVCGNSGCAALMRHLPKVAVVVTVRGKSKKKMQVAKCGCVENKKADAA